MALMAGMALAGRAGGGLGERSAWQSLALALLPMQVCAVGTFVALLRRERAGRPWGALLQFDESQHADAENDMENIRGLLGGMFHELRLDPKPRANGD